MAYRAWGFIQSVEEMQTSVIRMLEMFLLVHLDVVLVLSAGTEKEKAEN